jgi:hypothetical protein
MTMHDHLLPARAALLSVAERLASNLMLACYLDGWAEADPAKIASAAAQDYDFHDPLVGHFSRRTLPQYFVLLRSRFASLGVAERRDLAFTLRGPMTSHAGRHQYWREAPMLGLTGLAEITMRHGQVVAEVVAYDLNVACEMLRECGSNKAASAITPTRAAGCSNTRRTNHPP